MHRQDGRLEDRDITYLAFTERLPLTERRPKRSSKKRATSNGGTDEEAILIHFVETFGQIVIALGLQALRITEGQVILADADGNDCSVPIYALFQQIGKEDPEQWPNLIKQFLNSSGPSALARAKKAILRENADKLLPCFKPSSIGKVKECWLQPLVKQDSTQNVLSSALNLKSRQGSQSTKVVDSPDNQSALADLPYLTLVIDMPESMAFVTQEMLDKSGQPATEWLMVAKRNLRTLTPSDWFEVVDQKSGICTAKVHDCYDAPRMLLLDELLPEQADRGWFVAPVSRDNVYFVPASAEIANQYVSPMKRIAEEEFQSADYALSDEIFWVYEGQWYHYAMIEVIEGHGTVVAPQEFLQVFGIFDDVDEGNVIDMTKEAKSEKKKRRRK